MRKLNLQMQVSADGFVADINGELNGLAWEEWNWDDELKNYVYGLTDSIDCIVLGRKTAEGFIPYWQNVASNSADPQHNYGKKVDSKSKVVLTGTLFRSEWENTVLAKGNIEDEINQLKNQEGKDLIVYGGISVVSSLIGHKLVDELHLFVNPIVLGNGFRVFNERTGLRPVSSKLYASGITVLKFAAIN